MECRHGARCICGGAHGSGEPQRKRFADVSWSGEVSMSTKASTATWNPDVREEPEGDYSVASEKGPGIRYLIDLRSTPPCSCPSSQYRQGQKCKHVAAVEESIAARPSAASMSGEAKPASMRPKEEEEFFAFLEKSDPKLHELSEKSKRSRLLRPCCRTNFACGSTRIRHRDSKAGVLI